MYPRPVLPVNGTATPLPPRAVHFTYGNATDVAQGSATTPNESAILSRLTSVEESMNETDKRNVARLGYSGVSRRTGLWLGVVGSAFAAAQSVAALPPPPGGGAPIPSLPGLDGWGRVADLHYPT